MLQTSYNNQRIAKNTILLYVRMFVTMAIGFYTSRVILNALGITDYGLNNVVGGIVTMFTFINGSMALTTSRYLTYDLGKKDIKKLRDTFKCGLTIHAIIGLLVFVLAEFIGLWFLHHKMVIPPERFESALWVFHLSILGTFTNILIVPYHSDIISNEKMNAFAWISISDVTMKLLICYCITISPYDKLKTYAVLFFITTLLTNSIYVIYSRINFNEARFGFLWKENILKSMFSFAGWTLLGQLALVGYTQGLNMLLNIFFGPGVNAARGVAVQVQSVVYRFVSGFQTAFNPQLTKSYAQGDLDGMHRLIYSSSKFSYYLLLFLSIPVIFETRWLLVVWLKIVPDYTVEFFRIIIFTSFIETLAYPLIVSAMATGDVKKWNICVSAILLLIVPISYIALRLGASPASVFVIHLACVIVSQIVRLFLLKSLISLSIRSYLANVVLPVIKVSLIVFALTFLVYQYFHDETLRDVFVVAVWGAIVNILVVFFIGMNSRERNLVLGYVSKIKKIKK